MIRSMTGFARGQEQTQPGIISWEIRTVNHRYLDVSLRLAEEFRFLENEVRNIIKQSLKRGKVECHLKFQPESTTKQNLKMNEPLVKQLIKLTHQVASEMNNPARIDPLDLLKWPGVVEINTIAAESFKDNILTLLQSTLDDLIAHREREGEHLKSVIQQRSQHISQKLDMIKQQRPMKIEEIQQKWKEKLATFEEDADKSRLEQEMIIFIQKLDIDEETDRLASHLKELDRTLNQSDPMGRRLDFLLQEFNREANTIGSKASDAEVAQHTVEIKVLIEQIREQIQNIE